MKAGEQITETTRRLAARPEEMTTETTPESQAAIKAKLRRVEEPRGMNPRLCAYHGPGHEIVKKPFATPEGGDKRRGSREAARRKMSTVPEICWLDFRGRTHGHYRARRVPQHALFNIGRRRAAQAPPQLFTKFFVKGRSR